MSEQTLPTDDNLWDFQRVSPVVPVEIGGEERKLSYLNTMIYTFVGHWATVDHVYVTEEDENTPSIYSFDCKDIIEHLKELNFPYISMPFPSNTDLQAYSQYMSDTISAEVDEL